jgi:hypothetical protein
MKSSGLNFCAMPRAAKPHQMTPRAHTIEIKGERRGDTPNLYQWGHNL